MKYTAFLGVRFEPEWFVMSPSERDAFEAEHLFPILGKHAQFLQIRPFRASAFTTRHTNFFLVQFDAVDDYSSLIESLSESPLMSRRYVTITDNHIGIEEKYHADRDA